MLMEQRRSAAFLWCSQVDAAAIVGVEAKVDAAAELQRSGGARKKTMRRSTKGKNEKDPSALFIR